MSEKAKALLRVNVRVTSVDEEGHVNLFAPTLDRSFLFCLLGSPGIQAEVKRWATRLGDTLTLEVREGECSDADKVRP